MKGTLIFDIESFDRDLLYSMPPDEFVRLCGYQWLGGEVVITTDQEELREQIRQARLVVGHNIHDFDLRALFGVDSDEPLELTEQGRVFDTWTHAPLVFPAPPYFTNRFGKTVKAKKPDEMKRWFSLGELAYQLGVDGKVDDLDELARPYGDPELSRKARAKDGYGKIPIDLPEYREYLVGDVHSSREVARALLEKGSLDAYAMREQRIAARAAVITSNGIRLNQEAAQDRESTLATRRQEILDELSAGYDFPTEGKAPWSTDKGREAILSALADHGISEKTYPEWPRTPAGRLSQSGDALIGATKGTTAEDLGSALAELKGQRSLSSLALSCVYEDGFVHPEITMLQRSGRWSTTNPGMTIWDNSEKFYFVPDSDDEYLMAFDLSNADARIVAALSGDRKYAERFEEGADGHLINAWAAWGKDVVGTERGDPTTESYRQKAKPLGHGWSYGGGARTLSRESGVPYQDAKTFCDGLNREFKALVNWQSRVRGQVRNNRVYNDWGRPMHVEPGREFTQVPALHGQSGTREIMCDIILAMPISVLRKVKIQVHDELVVSIPKKNWQECRDYMLDLMHTSFKPKKGGQRIEFPASAGPPAETWKDAVH